MIASRSCCRFVGCTSMMWISRSNTSQRCSIGLISGECGGHLSKVNSLLCSRNQSEMIWALWHAALSCWKYIRRWGHCSHKGMDILFILLFIKFQYTVFAHLNWFALLFYCTFYSLFIFFFTYIYALVLCYCCVLYNFICILLHCPLSGPDLIYISLLIIPCIIYYVTNKETLTLTWSTTILRKTVAFKQCSIGTKGPKVCQENIPHTITPHQQPEPLRQGRMDPCFLVLYAKFWPYHLNVAAEIETHQTRQRCSNLLLFNLGEPVWIVSSVSCSYLTGAAPSVVFCCCSPSAPSGSTCCAFRDGILAYIGCKEWLL